MPYRRTENVVRRLAERDVRFIQLFHPGWDHHGGLPAGIRQLCRERGVLAAVNFQLRFAPNMLA